MSNCKMGNINMVFATKWQSEFYSIGISRSNKKDMSLCLCGSVV